MYKKVKVKIVILHKSLLKLSSWWFFLFYQEFSTKLKLLKDYFKDKTVIIDVTESQIQRPKKDKNSTTQEKRKNTQ
ncbi:hypothetical protein [Spiroplasma endosymbiont of Clivina fossor]|uniref:hypothetical protein n=1 Tax=Spiroplasma endosymbiont of Clivina fossor TaxID=3066282 RepID=UPI00313D4437